MAASHATGITVLMARVDDVVWAAGSDPVVICDISPPRGAVSDQLPEAARIDADFLYVAYNPGQSVRVNSMLTAAFVKDHLNRQTVFGLATRDMNRIAIQSLLLGAAWLGLENLVILRGDRLHARDRSVVQEVGDYTTTQLLTDISRLNEGYDFRGLPLRVPTSLCAGATADPAKSLDAEVALANRKLRAGAQFILCQPQYRAADALEFSIRLCRFIDDDVRPVLFTGVHILALDGVDFGNIPEPVRKELQSGRPPLDIAKEFTQTLWEADCRTFYVVPPILTGGRRDYAQAAELIDFLRALSNTRYE